MSNNKELKFQALVDAHKSLYGKIETDSIQLRCEYAVERARSWTECSSIENIISWLENCAKTSGMKVEEISLKEMANRFNRIEKAVLLRLIENDVIMSVSEAKRLQIYSGYM